MVNAGFMLLVALDKHRPDSLVTDTPRPEQSEVHYHPAPLMFTHLRVYTALHRQ